jgi:competence protein ComGC
MFFPWKSRKAFKGLTLAELLISLLILAAIATFTIPKILSSQQNYRKKVVIKETVATLNQILYSGVQLGEINASNFSTYMINNLNAVKLCPTNATSEGCVTAPVAHPNFGNYKGAILHNGALVTCGGVGEWGVNECFIDWNGTQTPNLINEDQLVVVLCYDKTDGRPGYLENHSYWTSDTLWASFFE